MVRVESSLCDKAAGVDTKEQDFAGDRAEKRGVLGAGWETLEDGSMVEQEPHAARRTLHAALKDDLGKPLTTAGQQEILCVLRSQESGGTTLACETTRCEVPIYSA